jgi:hypothetical protein
MRTFSAPPCSGVISSGSNAERMWMSGLAVAFGDLGSYVTDVFRMWHLMASCSQKMVALGSGGSRAGYTRGNCKETITSSRQLMHLIHLQLTEYTQIIMSKMEDFVSSCLVMILW